MTDAPHPSAAVQAELDKVNAVPFYVRRLQKPMMHKQHYSVELYPETRKLMCAAHAKLSSEYEYLPPGRSVAKANLPVRGERIFDRVLATEKLCPGDGMIFMDGKWRLKDARADGGPKGSW